VRLQKHFDVKRERDAAVAATASEAAVVTLFPEAQTEVVAREGDCITVRTHYNALGREGDATFHFTFLLDGDVAFEKVCDGNIWSRLKGTVGFEERGSGTRVTIELDGATRALVPEFTIRGPMKQQIEQMATALRERIETEGKA
jgi:carbon monoxide dehydrogenase subunit G